MNNGYLVDGEFGIVLGVPVNMNDKIDGTAIANEYSSESTYTVGDIVTHNGKLFKCTTAISTPETWTDAHWTETQVLTIIDDVKSVIDDEIDNLIDTEIPNVVKNTVIGANQIETALVAGEIDATDIGESYDKAQILDTNPLTYRITTNLKLKLTIIPIAAVSAVRFIANTIAAQWGSVLKIATENDVQLLAVSTTQIENNTFSFITFNSETRETIVDVNALKELYPTARKLWISSLGLNASFEPKATTTNQHKLSDFKWLEQPEEPKLIVPTAPVPAVVGMPVWCYCENVLENGFTRDYPVNFETQFKSRPEALKYIPTSAGNANFSVGVYDKEELVEQKTVTIQAVEKTDTQVRSVKVLCMGDSKTDAIGKRVRINELVADDEYLEVTFIGTHNTDPVKSEGYSGRNIIDVCTKETFGSCQNVFYDSSISGDNKFNFALGIQEIGETPDIVFIDHGTNQMSKPWTDVLACYEAIITSIHNYNANIKIVICIQESTSLAQIAGYTTGNKKMYGYGNDAANYSTRKMLEAFEGREAEKVYTCPQYLCVDLYNDYPLAELPTSETNPMKRKICLDVTHPGTNVDWWYENKAYNTYAYVRRGASFATVKPYAAVAPSTGVDPLTDDGSHWVQILNPDAGYKKIGDMYYAVIKRLARL